MSDSWIGRALDELSEVLSSKNQDYKIDGEFSNFEFAAEVVGNTVPVEIVMLTQIAIKLGRIQGLSAKEEFNNESYMDSVKDLAGYSVILLAYLMRRDHYTIHSGRADR